MLIFLLFITFIISTEQIGQSSTPSCQFRKITNCSCQVHSFENHWSTCQVFKGIACEHPHFPVFNKNLEGKHSFNFEIDAVPYALCKYPVQPYPFPAIKFTFSATLDGIQGFMFNLFDDLAISNPYNICRILDFRSLAYQQEHVSLSYDCLRAHLSSSNSFQFHVHVLPINKERRYKLFLPSVNEIDPADVCAWTPLIMVQLESLKRNIVEVKFSQAPEFLNITNYHIFLHTKNDGELTMVRKASVQVNPDNKSITIIFESVNAGYYYISVKAITANDTDCNDQRHLMIFVEGKLAADFKIIFYVCLLIASGIIVTVFIFLILKYICKPKSVLFPDPVLLIYSYDFDEHETAVESLGMFLKQFCNNVTTIYSRNKDPDEWLDVNYQNAAVIIFVLSFGTFHKLQYNNNPPMIEKHSWGDRFSPAVNLIYSQIRTPQAQKKKMIRICFEYSEISKMPQIAQSLMWGKIFNLPREMCEFLSSLRNDISTINCFTTSKLSLMQIIRSNPEWNALLKSVNKAKIALRKTSDSSIFFNRDCETVSLFNKRISDTPPPAYISSSSDEEDCDRESPGSPPFVSGPGFWDTFLSSFGASVLERDGNNAAERTTSFWDSICPLPDENLMPQIINNSAEETLDPTSICQTHGLTQPGGFWSNFEEKLGRI